jgi:outer membrane receptor protein involved in Fe transport
MTLRLNKIVGLASWGGGCVAAVLLGSVPERARAQQSPSQSVSAARASPSGGAPADTSELESVVVTAQYRAETAQSIPLSIVALDNQALDDRGALQFQDYANSIAGLSYASRGPNRDQIVIRGISPLTGVSAVGVYLDEIGSSNSFNNPDYGLFDVQRVEILRGPQGTLYGEGSLGGTIRIFTNKPSFDRPEAEVEAIGSSTTDGGNNGYLNGVVNVPLTDTLAVRLSGFDHHESGWIDNAFDNASDINWHRTQGGRLSVLFKPTADFDLEAIINTQHDRIGLENVQDPGAGRYKVDRLTNQAEDERNTQYTLIANYRALGGSFEEVFGYYRERDHRGVDSGATVGVPGLDLFYDQSNRIVSSETRYVSYFPGPFNFVAGFYYKSLERPVGLDLVDGGELFGLPGDYVNQVDFKNSVYAVYGEGYYNFTPALKGTIGVRWSREDVGSPSITSIGELVLDSTNLSGTYQATTPKFGLAYQASSAVLLFANIAEGYRAGGVNPIPPVPADPAFKAVYGPDKAWSYELGVKTESSDHRFLANATAYYIKWSDLQILGLPSNPALGFTTNAGDAHSAGFELELAARPLPGLELDLSPGFTNAVLDQPAQGSPAGTRLPDVPRWGLSAAAQYQWPVMRNWSGFARIDWSYKTSTNADVPPDAVGLIPIYRDLNLRVGVQSERYGIYLFGSNLTNDLGITSAGTSGQYVMRPRTVGIDLRAKFY